MDPIEAAEVRDRTDMRKGIGIDLKDPFEQFRKSKAQGFIQRMRARDEGAPSTDPPGEASREGIAYTSVVVVELVSCAGIV